MEYTHYLFFLDNNIIVIFFNNTTGYSDIVTWSNKTNNTHGKIPETLRPQRENVRQGYQQGPPIFYFLSTFPYIDR